LRPSRAVPAGRMRRACRGGFVLQTQSEKEGLGSPAEAPERGEAAPVSRARRQRTGDSSKRASYS